MARIKEKLRGKGKESKKNGDPNTNATIII
jgi:hypothetical protein